MSEPKVGAYVFDLANRRITRRGHRKFAKKLKNHGVKFLHIEATWGKHVTLSQKVLGILPFKRKFDWKGLLKLKLRFVADLDRIRPKYRRKLRIIKEVYEDECGIRVLFGLFDHCAEKKNYFWHPWGRDRNTQGVNGIYDTSAKALNYFMMWADFIIDDIGFTFINLYNEAKCPGNHAALKNWCRSIVRPLGEYIYDRVEKPIWTSGEKNTAHWITGVLSPEESNIFKSKDCGEIFHGICTVDEFYNRFTPDGDHGYSKVKPIGFSTDGCGVKKYPDDIRSDNCIPGERFCLPSEECLIASVKEMKKTFSNLALWENLIRETDYRHIRHIKQKTLELFQKIAELLSK